MKKKHFKHAATQIAHHIISYNFGVASMHQLEIYKDYVDFFAHFSKNFIIEKFDYYIKQKLKKK